MTTKGTTRRARVPLLDRLMDADGPGPDATTVETFRIAVRRDLERLLNARRRRRPIPAHLKELPTSLVNFGVPDPSSGTFAVPELRHALIKEIEATIRRFEPRLSGVSVNVYGDDGEYGNILKMRVEAVLDIDPAPELISFETLLEAVTRDIFVRET